MKKKIKYHFLTFEKAYLEYLEYAKLHIKPTTLLGFRRQIEKNVMPFFKNKKIKKIDVSDYLEWQKYVKNKGLKYIYRRNLHYDMCSIYNYLEIYYNTKNIPRLAGNFKDNFIIKEERKIWSIDEFNEFINSVDSLLYSALFRLLFFTGCRKGELLALTFKDFNNNQLTISKSISKEHFDGKKIILTPKTNKSIRKISIDSPNIENILKLKEYYKSIYQNFTEDFYIFGGNKPISTTTLERKKNFYCEKSGVKKIRLHDFRHSHATFLYQNNIPIKTISNRLGHASITTTLDTYIHESDENEKKVVELLSQNI